MSRKYISQVNNDNFVFPNNRVSEYDVEIIHDINDNCVSGSVINFSATTVTSTGMTISFDYIWDLNGATPFIRNSGAVSVLSLHMMGPTQNYYKPFHTVGRFVFSDIPITRIETGVTPGFNRLSFNVTPSMIGVTSFTTGTYYFEIKFIGERCVFPVCFSRSIAMPTPTPTPTPTNTPTPTPTPTNTPTPTPTSTPETGCTQSNVCMEFTVTGATGPEIYAGSISYNNCNGVLVNENFTTQGTRYRCIQYTMGVPQIFSSSGISTPTIAGGDCDTFPCPTGTTTTTSEWTVRNYDCGFGTLNDVGINGSFMGTLSGPSTFPLTSTLYGTKSNPSGINYGAANTIQANVTTNLPGTGNCAVLRVIINGVTPTPYETYFTTNPFPQVSGVIINTGDAVTVEVDCFEGPCPDVPTPTPTATPTPTPTATATPTPTPTFTSTPTPTPSPTAACVTSVSFDVDSAGEIRYVDCCNNTIYLTFGIGPQVINDCIQNGSLFAVGATISNISYGITSCNCVTPTPTPTSTPTPTPTSTPSAEGSCFCLTYTTIPNDLYVRYRNMSDTTVTELIQGLETMDNGNGTYTACICVLQGGPYATPVCVQGGIEVTCDPYTWVQGGSCTIAGTCFLG